MSKFDEALKRLKDGLVSPASKIEGTFTMSNLRSVAKESALQSNNLEILENNWSLDTAAGQYLDAKVADYGLYRLSANFAFGPVEFTGLDGVTIPPGTRVAAPDYGVQFETRGTLVIHDGKASGVAQAVTTGPEGNVPAGAIIKLIKQIDGVTGVINTGDFMHGSNRETDDDLRLRALFAIRNPRTSGNVNDYIMWATEIGGVGKVKVFPLWDGPGTVKVALTAVDGSPADGELVQEVQNHIDPVDPYGAAGGGGVAPIGAKVTVVPAVAKTVNVSAKVDLGTKGDLEAVKKDFEVSLKEFFTGIAYDGKTYNISPALVGFRLLQTPGVVDYSQLKLNGSDVPVTVSDVEVFQVGTIELVEAVGA